MTIDKGGHGHHQSRTRTGTPWTNEELAEREKAINEWNTKNPGIDRRKRDKNYSEPDWDYDGDYNQGA